MKKLLSLALSIILLTGASVVLAGEVETLQPGGASEVMAKSLARRSQTTIDGGFKRSWKLQPPLIPHKIDSDQVTLHINTCMKCHSAEAFKREKAPKAGDSHFVVAKGVVSNKLNTHTYFCTQCHAPQTDAELLIENTFTP